jgi:subtilisin family serine protease
MQRPGHVTFVLRSGEARPRVASYLDCLCGASRHASQLDIRAVDRVLARGTDGFRACCVYHSRRSLGKIGQQHAGFDDVEEQLGLSRTYRVELADARGTEHVVGSLRELSIVEQAGVETLAFAPSTARTARPGRRQNRFSRDDLWTPHRQVHAPQALRIEAGDEGVTCAVVDTGVALGHAELQRRLKAGFDTVDIGIGRVGPKLRLIGDSRGRDFSAFDGTGHGSHVAGIIGAQGWRIPPGTGGRTLILPIRVLAAAKVETEGNGKSAVLGVGAGTDISIGLKVAIDLGADIINMSFGTPERSVDPDGPQPHADVVRYALHYGCVPIAAMGNSGTPERYYPAALPGVISVGSVNRQGDRSTFSSYGGGLTLCAPGERIVSLGCRGYAVSSGTSQAAPFVSGAAALLVSRARRNQRRLEAADVERLLVLTATPLSGGGFHRETGHGLLNIEAALRRLDQEICDRASTGKPRGAA